MTGDNNDIESAYASFVSGIETQNLERAFLISSRELVSVGIRELGRNTSRSLLEAVDAGLIHIAEAFIYWLRTSDILPIYDQIHEGYAKEDDCGRRGHEVFYKYDLSFLFREDQTPFPCLEQSNWQKLVGNEYVEEELLAFSWAQGRDENVDYESVYRMMRTLIKNNKGGFIYDW